MIPQNSFYLCIEFPRFDVALGKEEVTLIKLCTNKVTLKGRLFGNPFIYL